MKKDFQNHKELHIGSTLMEYVLKNKEAIENFNYAKVEPTSKSNEQLDTFHKRI